MNNKEDIDYYNKLYSSTLNDIEQNLNNFIKHKENDYLYKCQNQKEKIRV